MTHVPFRLVFRRAQSKGNRPSFSLTVSAEMTPEFMDAAKTYGAWNELVYADPKLDEARQLRLEKAERKQARANRRARAITGSLPEGTFIFLLPMYLCYKLTKWILLGPFKIAWWIFKAQQTQRKQIIRFHELVAGKTITTQSVREVVEAEEIIKQTTNTITAEVLAAMNYSGEAFEPGHAT